MESRHVFQRVIDAILGFLFCPMENSRNFSQRKTDEFHGILPWSIDEIRDVFPRVIDAIRDKFFSLFPTKHFSWLFTAIGWQISRYFNAIDWWISRYFIATDWWIVEFLHGQWTTFELLFRDRLTNIIIFSSDVLTNFAILFRDQLASFIVIITTYWRYSRWYSLCLTYYFHIFLWPTNEIRDFPSDAINIFSPLCPVENVHDFSLWRVDGLCHILPWPIDEFRDVSWRISRILWRFESFDISTNIAIHDGYRNTASGNLFNKEIWMWSKFITSLCVDYKRSV